MLVIDSQVHAYEQNSRKRPWLGQLQGPDSVTGTEMVEAMDAAGVDGALLVSPYNKYRYDGSYALEVHAEYPNRFGLIKPFNPLSESVSEEIAEWALIPGVVGARLMLSSYELEPDYPGFDRVFEQGADSNIPINVMCSGKLDSFHKLASRHPNTRLVVDHVGLTQPFMPPLPPNPFADIPSVLELANLDNVAIKISGACTLSKSLFPFNDIWEPLGKVFRAFGLERCMWGTDWTRALEFLSYEEGVDAFVESGPLTETERQLLMGQSLMEIYNWSPNST